MLALTGQGEEKEERKVDLGQTPTLLYCPVQWGSKGSLQPAGSLSEGRAGNTRETE